MRKKRLSNAYLAGPFVGEFTWEFLRFAPYVIYLKKNMPKTKLIVFTRPFRFDLYGQYADILVPLRLPFDNVEKECGFTYRDLSCNNYNNLAASLLNKYKDRFNIIRHIYPDITYFYSKVKWQFPRSEMDYDFRPRKQNIEFVKKYENEKNVFINFNFSEKMYLVEHLERDYLPIFINIFNDDFLAFRNKNISFLGCIIELLKRCEFIITEFSSYIAALSLLIGTPVISVGETPPSDSISLINPLNTMVVKCDDIIDGINIMKGEKNANNF